MVLKKNSRQQKVCKIIQLFSCSPKWSMKFIMLNNVKMPTIVGTLTLMSMINIISVSLKAKKCLFFGIFSFMSVINFMLN